ncbi:hypothetical protein MANY_35960 [Mycolicibacterium anyangense]|jgi:hypothetical protein|uniref:Uncharacterized protein n=1 Tax=Mycolicibacterium anyangense TaxID=1431246 RepID=A0A6N4WB42_9MYCO|nr:hypothetical protein [Mycolicibacterium anyangense]BBZ78259.1 hypothetical protein MANY_35960 [Mycolicibacterium anyangense]
MNSDVNLKSSSDSRKRLLAATVGSGALAVMALFGIAHSLPTADTSGVTADSGKETKMPGFTSPAVSGMEMGATTTMQPTDEPTALATTKAVPAITPAGN